MPDGVAHGRVAAFRPAFRPVPGTGARHRCLAPKLAETRGPSRQGVRHQWCLTPALTSVSDLRCLTQAHPPGLEAGGEGAGDLGCGAGAAPARVLAGPEWREV